LTCNDPKYNDIPTLESITPNPPHNRVERVFLWGFMSHHQPFQNVGDITLATGLAASPAWVPWLDSLNQLLTTSTLLVGMVLGVTRLWTFWREWRSTDKDE
jgi:hypothetical protein